LKKFLILFITPLALANTPVCQNRSEDIKSWEEMIIPKGFILSKELDRRNFSKIYKKQIPAFKEKNPKIKNVDILFPKQKITIQSCSNDLENEDTPLVLPVVINNLKTFDLEIKNENDQFFIKLEDLKRTISSVESLDLTFNQEWISLDDLNKNGFLARFDDRKVLIEIFLPIDQKKIEKMSLSKGREIEGELLEKAKKSGFVNISSTLTYKDSDNKSISEPTFHRFDGALNFSDYVFEFNGYKKNQSDFVREDLRLSKDIGDSRFSVGDLFYPVRGFQSYRRIGGFSAYSLTKDNLANSPLSAKASDKVLEIKQPSKLTFFVNNTVVAVKSVVPGFYDVSEIPLTSGVNQIRVEVEADQSGEKNTFFFEDFMSDFNISKGRSEYGLALGQSYKDINENRTYDNEDKTALFHYRYDFSNKYSTTSYFESNPTNQLLGLIQAFHVSGGHIETDIGVSNQNSTISSAFRVGYFKNNSKKFCLIDGDRYSFNYEQRNKDFTNVETSIKEKTSSLNLTYSLPKIGKNSISFSTILNKTDSTDYLKTYSVNYSTSIKEAYLSLSLINSDRLNQPSEVSASLSLNLNLDQSTATLSHSYQNKTNTESFSYNSNKEPGFKAQGSLSESDSYITKSVQGTLSTNRNEITLSVNRNESKIVNSPYNRYSFNHRVSLAFADDKFAIGRPISDSFWISDSKKKADLLQNGRKAEKDSLGEALLGFQSYSFANVKALSGNEGEEESQVFKSFNNFHSGYVVRLKNLISPSILKIKTKQDLAGSLVFMTNLSNLKTYEFFIDSNYDIYLEQIEAGNYEVKIQDKTYRLNLEEENQDLSIQIED